MDLETVPLSRMIFSSASIIVFLSTVHTVRTRYRTKLMRIGYRSACIRIIFENLIRIRIRIKGWMRIRIKVKIQKQHGFKIEPWRAMYAHNGDLEAENGSLEDLLISGLRFPSH
jgi:hypothetical protein